MYYPCSVNKGTDQLRGYREADLRLCFRICRLLVFSRGGSDKFCRKYNYCPEGLHWDYIKVIILCEYEKQNTSYWCIVCNSFVSNNLLYTKAFEDASVAFKNVRTLKIMSLGPT